MSDLAARDRRVAWHPYTQHGIESDPLTVVGARGARLELADGRSVVDAISSWWATLHGHGRPELVRAMERQASQLDHVLFAGATHAPAVELAEQVLEVAPPGLDRVFYSDDGSTAVEVAMKMVLQSWVHRSEPQRRVFVALEGAYHGDTFGAMAAGDPDPFFVSLQPLLFEVCRVPADADALREAIEQLGDRAAGFVFEPLLQGAAGMRLTGIEFARAAREVCDAHGLPLIADEVMTGFGRTGAMFACELAGIAPDLLCLAKGLTGGTLPLAATLATEALFECFLSDDRSRFFPHGHTFTANPIACAVALASLRICRDEETPLRLADIGARLSEELQPLRDLARVRDLRHLGGMVAFDLVMPDGDSGYMSTVGPWLRSRSIELGVLLRPLGNVLYALPPACTDEGEVALIAEAMRTLAEEAP